MWWGKPHRRSHSFAHSASFKDIQELCKEDEHGAGAGAGAGGGPVAIPRPKRASSIFHRVRIATAALRSFNSLATRSEPVSDGEKRIVVYLTSLRVVRKTFDDCRSVQSILKGFRLSIDERDLSMHPGFLDELKGILGKKNLTLPRVFIGGRYMGGAEEIRQLHETGELKKILEGFPRAEPGVCGGCGGLRFVLCGNCSGSHKCYSEKGGFRICSTCNENGLVRCPACC
ncbi:hypothetical protein MRB53_003933 [Persea americana]|uniref:Uncharacterized protein n=1 Tax=Persea americana TaxID=3435 RepID=A0ACC2MZ44_PERAE|nr:hypothetical protein MRB53_003933 [Persea americana]|eukprot:TRINITY_DN11187_c1_g1_i2.p1 TRINITY_DN11187_c1_g1~~TRINITY_DN11187_c1_g1_i2.p1  ORF type:complete len:229 (+),score=21.15 TRINITY_DN11187_c1_g1_i2:698-1384(+)